MNRPGSGAERPQERPAADLAPSGAHELFLAAQAAVWGSPGVVDGQVVVVVKPLEGLRALRQLRQLVDDLEPQLVAKARERQYDRWGYRYRELHSWAEISEAIGVPKNTLHRRYGPGGGG